jgi:acyl-CoA thioesterase II
MSHAASGAVDALLDILNLERLEHNLFRGESPANGWRRVFGGQVVAQALSAAACTVEGRAAHSLHAYFLRGGDPKAPILYEVDRIRDGESFTTRRVVAIQHGQAIFTMAASFHRDEAGFSHQIAMPDAPPPEELPSENELKQQFAHAMPEAMRLYWETDRAIEFRPVDVSRFRTSGKRESAAQNIWIRTAAPLPDDVALHQCVLAYASDYTILDTALIAHGRLLFDPELMLASLDHAIWFHRPFRADEWLLYCQDSPSAEGARGFCRGSVFTRDGRLAASIVQEGLMRECREPR